MRTAGIWTRTKGVKMAILEIIFHYSLVCWIFMLAIQIREGLRHMFTSKVPITFTDAMQTLLMIAAAPVVIPVIISELFKE